MNQCACGKTWSKCNCGRYDCVPDTSVPERPARPNDPRDPARFSEPFGTGGRHADIDISDLRDPSTYTDAELTAVLLQRGREFLSKEREQTIRERQDAADSAADAIRIGAWENATGTADD